MALSISEAMYCGVISGQRSLPGNHVKAIARLLGADPPELRALGIADKMLPETSAYTDGIVGKALKIVNENHQ